MSLSIPSDSVRALCCAVKPGPVETFALRGLPLGARMVDSLVYCDAIRIIFLISTGFAACGVSVSLVANGLLHGFNPRQENRGADSEGATPDFSPNLDAFACYMYPRDRDAYYVSWLCAGGFWTDQSLLLPPGLARHRSSIFANLASTPPA